MNDRTKNMESTAFMPEDERWVHESEFKKRLEWADSWMQDYIPRYPYREGDKWVVLHMNFQCEMYRQSNSTQAAILTTIKMDWSSVLQPHPI